MLESKLKCDTLDFIPASSDLLCSCTRGKSEACSHSSQRGPLFLWGTGSCHVCWEGVIKLLVIWKSTPLCHFLHNSRLTHLFATICQSVLPADQHLFRLEGVGCHDPGCHSEHHTVCENGRLGDSLLKHDRGRRVTSPFLSAWYWSAITFQPPVNHCVHTPFLAKNYFTCWGTDFTRPKRTHCDMRHKDVSGSPLCCTVGAALTSHRRLVGLRSEEFGGKVDTSNFLCFYAARQGQRNCPQLFSRQNTDQTITLPLACLLLKVQMFYLSLFLNFISSFLFSLTWLPLPHFLFSPSVIMNTLSWLTPHWPN